MEILLLTIALAALLFLVLRTELVLLKFRKDTWESIRGLAEGCMKICDAMDIVSNDIDEVRKLLGKEAEQEN